MKGVLLGVLVGLSAYSPLTPVFGSAGGVARSGPADQPTPCPQVQLWLDGVAQAAGPSTVIAIARLGDSESSRRLNVRRLYNVRAYLTEHRGDPLVPDAHLVTATGEKTRGLGRVEIYVKGELMATFLVRRGQDLHVAECESGGQPWYYGERPRGHRKKSGAARPH